MEKRPCCPECKGGYEDFRAKEEYHNSIGCDVKVIYCPHCGRVISVIDTTAVSKIHKLAQALGISNI